MGIFNTFQHYLAAYSITGERVTLPGYGSFTGTTINTTLTGHPLPAPVHAWLGIDYASQPIGADRFRPVGPPVSIDGNAGQKDASQYGKVCIQDEKFIGHEQDEACLNMNVFRPVGIEIDKKLPVLVWIHGGGFVSGSGRSFDGASFVASAKSPLMAVTFNHRINSLGFLPSPLFEKEGLLNLGLLDQVQLLKFVQQYISNFGGDPSKVTLGGRSAGGHSVGMHYFSNNTNDTPLFSKAILQSGSVIGRSFPNSYYPLYLTQFAEYLSIIKCNNTAETLACLRRADINKIRAASSKLFADSEYAITWPFQPTLGGPLLEQPGSQSGIEKKFYRVPLITTNVNDEAKLYTPGNLTNNADFLQFMKTLLPSLNTTDLSLLESLYPDPDPSNPQTGGNSPYANSPNSTQYDRLSAATSDYQYICPGQETAFRASTEEIPTWKLRFNTNNFFPEWQGIPHTSDTKYTWNAPVGDVEYPEVGEILHGYFASFVVEGDPNLLRKEGSLVWPRYRVDDGGVVGVGRQLVIEPDETKVEVDEIRREQCAFWRDPERAGRLHK